MAVQIRSTGERVFGFFNAVFLVLVALVMLVPMLAILKDSVDLGGQADVRISLIPKEFTTMYYAMVFRDPTVYRPFLNSVGVTVVGTVLGVFINSMAAYAMSRRELRGTKFFVYFLVVVPMVVGGGGIIAEYIYYRIIGIANTYFVLILPGLAAGFYMILIRQHYWSIPFSLTESAQLDGAGEFTIFRRVIAPLSNAIYAAIALYTGVGFWNSWYNALIFIHDPAKYTFPVKLRMMLFYPQDAERWMYEYAQQLGIDIQQVLVVFEGLSSAIIIVAVVPVILIYPYLQKHFAAGVRVGAIKA
jgi:putative aldouronate transport system permease protein